MENNIGKNIIPSSLNNDSHSNPNNDDSENELMYIYEWVDKLPLSRPKKNISRDFCDATLLAEIIKYYIPKIVEIHNYPPASSLNQKCYNWTTLNAKVLKKLGLNLSKTEINDVISCKALAIEGILRKVYNAIENATGLSLGSEKVNSQNGKTWTIQQEGERLKQELVWKDNILKQWTENINRLKVEVTSAKNGNDLLRKELDDLNRIIQQKSQNKGMNMNNS